MEVREKGKIYVQIIQNGLFMEKMALASEPQNCYVYRKNVQVFERNIKCSLYFEEVFLSFTIRLLPLVNQCYRQNIASPKKFFFFGLENYRHNYPIFSYFFQVMALFALWKFPNSHFIVSCLRDNIFCVSSCFKG